MKNWYSVEELAKFEQRLSAKRGKFVSLDQTPPVKTLSDDEKKEFSRYLNRKKRRTKVFFFAIIFSLFFGIILRSQLVGNVIGFGEASNWLSLIFIFLFIGLVVVLAISNISEKKRSEKYKQHVKIAELSIHQ